MKIFVCGPESSGTKLMGCLLFEAGGDVIHRSFPYGGGPRPAVVQWPEDGFLFDVAVVMARDPHALVRSQIDAGRVTNEAWAMRWVREAYRRIFHLVRDKPFFVMPFEALMLHDQAFNRLCDALNLDHSRVQTEVGLANAKYYGGDHFRDQRPIHDRHPA